MNQTESKPLGHADIGAFDLVKEVLCGQDNFGLNFDRLCFDRSQDRFVLFEFQKCSDEQFARGITPHTSHPSRYWNRCWRKYVALWRAVQKLEAVFYVINYSEAGTEFADQVRVIEIMSLSQDGIKKSNASNMTRAEFGIWFRELNSKCQG